MAVARPDACALFYRRAERFSLFDRAYQTVTRRLRSEKCGNAGPHAVCGTCGTCARNEKRQRVRRRLGKKRAQAKRRLHQAHARVRAQKGAT